MMEDVTLLGELLPRFITELLFAIICGGLIGLDLARKRSYPAALRDCVLVCLATVLFMISAGLMTHNPESPNVTQGLVVVAATILAAAIISVGVILRGKGESDSIAVGMAIWVVAGIGVVIGSGYPMLGLLITGLTLLTMTMLRGFESHFSGRSRPFLLKLNVKNDSPEFRTKLNAILKKHEIKPEGFRSEKGPYGVRLTIDASDQPEEIRTLITDLWTIEGVTEVEH